MLPNKSRVRMWTKKIQISFSQIWQLFRQKGYCDKILSFFLNFKIAFWLNFTQKKQCPTTMMWDRMKTASFLSLSPYGKTWSDFLIVYLRYSYKVRVSWSPGFRKTGCKLSVSVKPSVHFFKKIPVIPSGYLTGILQVSWDYFFYKF